MYRLIPNLVLCGSLVSAGCTNWAAPGSGGAAEDYPVTLETTELEFQLDQAHELRQDLNHVQRLLDVLVLEGAADCLPASVHEARLRENRIAREIAGGLHADAETSLIAQRLWLAKTEQRLDTILKTGDCRLTAAQGENEPASGQTVETAAPQASLDEIEALFLRLNSDNQFALDSDRINPKYAANLARACDILIVREDIRLAVVGHSDPSGTPAHNLELSARRAGAVVDYLVACGVAASRIDQEFQGDRKPMYTGNTPTVNLVNRRVSVELVVEHSETTED